MVDADNFDVLQQVAHVFTSQQVLALQAKIKRDEELYELTRIAVCELSVDRFKAAIEQLNLFKIKCDCFHCFQIGFCRGQLDISKDHCALAEEFGRLCEKHSITWKVCVESPHRCETRRMAPWHWDPRQHAMLCHCEHVPAAHILTNVGMAAFRFGVRAWDITKLEDLRPLQNLLKDIQSYCPAKKDVIFA